MWSSNARNYFNCYWNGWEYYFHDNCPDSLPEIEGVDLAAWIDGAWRQMNSTFGYEWDTMDKCQYERRFTSKYNYWQVTGNRSGILKDFREGNLSGTGSTYTYSLSGDTKYTVVMAGNENADFDLYAKWCSPPTTSSYDALGFSGTSLEYFTTSGSGTLYIMVRAYSGSGHWKSWVISREPCDSSDRKIGALTGTNDEDHYSLTGSGIGGYAYVFTSGPDSSDFDLYLRWQNPPTTSEYDDCGFSGYSQDIAYHTGADHDDGNAVVYWMVRSWYGSGEYATLALVF